MVARLRQHCPGARFCIEGADASRFRKSGAAFRETLAASGPVALVVSGKARTIAIAIPGDLPFLGEARFKLPLANFERFPSTSLYMLGVDIGVMADEADRRIAWLLPFSGADAPLLLPLGSGTPPALSNEEASDMRIGRAVRGILTELGLPGGR